jgi:hypothetical protein
MRQIRYVMVALIPVFMMVHTPAGAAAPSWNEAKVISEATGGRFKDSAGTYFDKDCNQETAYKNDVVDLNGDGQPEVFVSIEGTCWGGMTGVFLDLMIKGADGKWKSQFGFPGIYQVLETKNKGYPDIEIGGPGFCFPIWRWNGKEYAIHKKCPQ